MKKVLIALSLIFGLLFTSVCFAECNKEIIDYLEFREAILNLEIEIYKGDVVVIQYQDEVDAKIQLITGKILNKHIETRMTEEGCVYRFPLLVVESKGQILLLKAWGIKDITTVKK